MPKGGKTQTAYLSRDLLLVIPVVGLLIFGFIGLYSTSLADSLGSSAFSRQGVFLVIALLIVWGLHWVHPRIYHQHAYRLYVLLIMMLVVTYFMPAISGGRRWLFLGSLRVQPSEIGKILVVLALARYLTDYHKHLHKFLYTLGPLAIVAVPALLIIGQPDLGTAMVFMGVAFAMMYWSGISVFHLFVIMSPALSLVTGFNFYTFSIWMLILVLALYFSEFRLRWRIALFTGNALFGTLASTLWNSLQPYQQRRILTLLDAASDPMGAGYQVAQSRTAIGAGGLFGKGVGEGTQTHLRFLPVTDTDFIIAVIGEEMGFLAIMTVLILFAWLFLRLLDRAATTQYRFASLTIVGFAAILLVHVFVNMGMATGLMPVTGLPLPFMSYGGSFLLTCLLLIGLTHYLLAGEI